MGTLAIHNIVSISTVTMALGEDTTTELYEDEVEELEEKVRRLEAGGMAVARSEG